MNTETFRRHRCPAKMRDAVDNAGFSRPCAPELRKVVLRQIANGWIAYWATGGIAPTAVYGKNIFQAVDNFEEHHKVDFDDDAKWHVGEPQTGLIEIQELK